MNLRIRGAWIGKFSALKNGATHSVRIFSAAIFYMAWRRKGRNIVFLSGACKPKECAKPPVKTAVEWREELGVIGGSGKIDVFVE